jgi:16S rRNA (uracil1498-N3)-methyltransferase
MYKKKVNTVTIESAEILSQVRKVIRANIGDILRIQDPINEAEKTRYEVRIDNWNDKELQGTILSETHHHVNPGNVTMIIAMPNKRDKAELIVQKLSEIGIDEIIFRPTERSVIKEWSEKKEERLQKISKEAVEQSRGWKIPEISFATDIQEYINNKDIIIFDKKEQESSPENIEKSEKNSIGIVGPE